jgi:hypothetical protein
MTNYGMTTKKIVFTDTDKRHADLKVRLDYDSLTQTDFFRAMLTGYVEKDDRILEYLYDWREQNKKYSKKKRNKSEKLLSKGDSLMKEFGLEESEIESIFDLLEQEHPDL